MKEHREEVLELEFRIIDNFGVEGEEWWGTWKRGL